RPINRNFRRPHERGDWLSLQPSVNQIVTSSLDKTARVWDSSDDKATVTLTGHTQSLQSAAFSPDGRRVITASGCRDDTTRVWDPTRNRAVATLTGHSSSLRSARFSPDDRI